MSYIDDLLSRALLVRVRTVPRDVVPPRQSNSRPAPQEGKAEAAVSAAEDLRALCETFVTHTPASAVADFVTEQVPQPRSALVLACVLQLTDTNDGARSWWEYAAGAGMPAAAYCLYLHHLALGERDTAAWWHTQSEDVRPAPRQDCQSSTGTLLRVLRQLTRSTHRPRSAVVRDLMNYIPTAVASGYLREPDVDLPMPGPQFAARVNTLVDCAARRPVKPGPNDLPARPRAEDSPQGHGNSPRSESGSSEQPSYPPCGEPANR
ncbi:MULTISPECIES: hypothetical protein [unclassified Streptomyces]|uniref:hypothetical protein n=1 Tax=unclassified Streptomyces TaxID=2593676 RepID=UPI00278C1D20|nr:MULTISPECIES: hypothetical protein [unclassified Streptomyces]